MRSATSLAPSGVRRLVLVVVLGALTGLAPLSTDMYLPSLPNVANDLHTSESLTQLTLTFSMVGLALGQLIAGPISDARGRRGPLLAGMAVYTLSSLLCAWAPSIWVFVLLRLIQGLAGASGIVIARAIARDYFSGNALTRFFSVLMLVMGFAPVIAPVAGGQIVRFTSWHGVFVVLAALGLLLIGGIVWGVPESLPPDRRMTGGIHKLLSTMRTLLRDRHFMGYVLTQSCGFAALFAYISGSPFVLQRVFGLTPQGFSYAFASNAIGLILAGQISGRAATRWGEHRVLSVGLTLALLSSLALLTGALCAAGLTWILPCLFLIVASYGCISPTSTSLALHSQGHAAGSASALMGVISMLLAAVISPLVGMGGIHSAAPVGWAISACNVGAALAAWWLARSAGDKTVSDLQAGI
ncbi:MAG: multidrug effflux MFS transporter [Alicyclobacillus sp.]|nr:multidrug effflux MFS transporter [Alicyclobacillus sp.]